MDLLLFDRYGLSINENNLDVINSALEKSKAESKWVKNLKAKNDKILRTAKKEQEQWESDRKVLTDSFARTSAAQEITGNIIALIEYIDEHRTDEKRFENAVSAFIELNLTANTVEEIYKKYSSVYGTASSEEKVKSYKKLARDLVVSYGAFINVVNSINDNIKDKFYEAGVDLTDFASALRLDECADSRSIIRNSEAVSAAAYEIYNSKLLNDAEKNEFMDIFSETSNSPKSLVKTAQSPDFDDFSFAGWATVKNINYVCRYMDSEVISENSISEIPPERRTDFIKAMKKLFGIKNEGSGRSDHSQEKTETNVIPKEIKLGEAELRKSDFGNAKKYFQTSINKNPYCWQGYWGIVKSELHAVRDEEVCRPGFMSQIIKKNSGESVDEVVELYSRAKELAVIQQTKDINFYNIENRFREADRKEEDFESFKTSLANDYGSMKTERIRNKEYPSFIQSFEKKAKVYSKKRRVAEDGLVMNFFLIMVGIYTVLLGVLGNSFVATGTYSDALALTTIISGSVIAIALGFLFSSFWVGLIVGGVLFGVDILVGDSFHTTLIPSILMGFGVLCLLVFVIRIIRRLKVKKTFDDDTKELMDFLTQNVCKCFWDDLMEYYRSNDLKSYGITVDESVLSTINFNSYLSLMGALDIDLDSI